MERLTHRLMIVPPLFFLLCSCSSPARYIVISEDSTQPHWESADQRYVCLAPADARTHRDLLALRTRSDIQEYERKRTNRQDPMEGVLFYLIRDEYPKASELLHQHEAAIPEYLRLLLNADFAYEEAKSPAQFSRLIKQYQDAFDVQPCAVSRAIIQLRIRQVRYLR
jgi:hypothetical protein